MFVYKIIDVYFICVDVSARARDWLIYENLDLKIINILLKRLFHKRSFLEIILKKKFAIKCYETVLFTPMNWYWVKKKLIHNWIRRYFWYEKFCGLFTNWPWILMPGLHLQLNRRKSRAPPPTQPSLIFKDLRRLRCWWSPTLKIYDGWVAGGARLLRRLRC